MCLIATDIRLDPADIAECIVQLLDNKTDVCSLTVDSELLNGSVLFQNRWSV
jgi:hypothetical protein